MRYITRIIWDAEHRGQWISFEKQTDRDRFKRDYRKIVGTTGTNETKFEDGIVDMWTPYAYFHHAKQEVENRGTAE